MLTRPVIQPSYCYNTIKTGLRMIGTDYSIAGVISTAVIATEATRFVAGVRWYVLFTFPVIIASII